MDKRVFQIDQKCYIIYTGQSSADNISFLRIGNSSHIDENIQKHIRYIVVNDAKSVDIVLEKENIKNMEKGRIKYICNKQNQLELFGMLKEKGVDIDNLYIKKLSKDMDNISRIENKKHFFTIFYDNKDVKLVSNEEIFFDLFEAHTQYSDTKAEITRLNNFISTIDSLNAQCKKKKNFKIKETAQNNISLNEINIFILQEDVFIPLSFGMFQIIEIGDNFIDIGFNNSQKFAVGKALTLTILEKGEKKYNFNGEFIEGEVIESMVLYNYYCRIIFDNIESQSLFVQFYKFLFNRI